MPHIHELIDFVVDAFIVHENKVLLIFHKKLKMWLCVGGHIELNEDPETALFREIQEECGLEVEILSTKAESYPNRKSLLIPNFLDIHSIGDSGHKHVALVYFAKAKSDKFKLAEDEHDDIRWFTEEELSDPKFNILPDIQAYARKALKKAS